MSALMKIRERFGTHLGILAGLGLGAGIMYLADPGRGRRRRATACDKLTSTLNHAERAVGRTLHDLGHRAQGAMSETVAALLPERVPDEVLRDRVRTRLGRLTAHPGAIEVAVKDGRVRLTGDVLDEDHCRVFLGVRLIRGVREVTDELQPHAEPGEVPGLQGAGTPRGCEGFELLRARWTPGTRGVMGAAGIALAVLGARRRGWSGAGMGLAGLGMLVRSLTNRGPVEGMGFDPKSPGITVQKTATIDAPVERVFELLMNPERLPSVMEHIQEVKKIDETHYHWTAEGPGGVPLGWDTEITNIIPNQLLAWRSTPGATIRNAGVVQFVPAGEGSTRVHIRMSYMPPGGLVGHTIAELLDIDPKHELDRDMARFKSLLERGKTRAHHKRVTMDDIED
ncbi:MAG: SRPBCC family protein [Terriglobales bacterium]